MEKINITLVDNKDKAKVLHKLDVSTIPRIGEYICINRAGHVSEYIVANVGYYIKTFHSIDPTEDVEIYVNSWEMKQF